MSQRASDSTAAPTNLPLQLTRFIGREREVSEVTRLLTEAATECRLLTLVGAGGCGKTRLALRVADNSLGQHPDGVWYVDLAPLADPDLVGQTVAAVLGVRKPVGPSFAEAIADHLRPKSALIVLDNCEHLVSACAELAETLLHRCPRIQILATSREVLGSKGETTWRVPSLSLPPPSDAPGGSLDLLTNSEAVRLFLDRATAVQSGFTPTDQSLWAVGEICRRLDGIPLAIELAAARMNVLSVEQIAARLDNCFGLLTGGSRTAMPRQRTLRATVDWSYDLLSEPERALLRRLSVFAGGCTLEAAETVAAGNGVATYAVLDLLGLLIDKSLVLAEQQRGGPRYRLLETIRQYASSKLGEVEDERRARDRHLDYYLRLAEAAEPNLRLDEQPKWVERLAAEHDNLRAALEWALSGGRSEAALHLSGALGWFWWLRGSHDEGRRWLTRALSAAPARSTARVRALYGAGWLAHQQRDSATAQRLLEESLSIAREAADRWSSAWVLHLLGRVAYFDNDPIRTRALADESLVMARELGDEWLIAWALHLMGLAAFIGDEYAIAQEYYKRSLEIRQVIGYQEGVAILLVLIGIAAFRERDYVEAHEQFRQALAAIQELHAPLHFSHVFAASSGLAAVQSQPERAVRLAAASARLTEAHHTPLIPMSEALLAEGLELARGALDSAAYARVWEDGLGMSLERSIAEALAVEVLNRPPPRHVRAGVRTTGLTPAELEVLRLLASGRTTREIAQGLVLAVSTVDRHLTHIYTKLGVRNRAAATSFALTHGLFQQ